VERGKRVGQIDEMRGADATVEYALKDAQPGDLILIQADTVDETVAFIRRYIEMISPEPSMEAAHGIVPDISDTDHRPVPTETLPSNGIPETSAKF
jgi:hypothetical protein